MLISVGVWMLGVGFEFSLDFCYDVASFVAREFSLIGMAACVDGFRV